MNAPWRRRDDEDHVRTLYRAHGAELYRFALRSLRDRPLAEEATQETFLRAWRNADRFDPTKASERTWLFAICRNVVVDLARARSVRPLLAPVDHAPAATPVVDPTEDVAMSMHIDHALGCLSDAHRHALVETYYRGRSYSDVAAEAGVNESTMRSRVFHGLKALRAVLDEMEATHA